MLIHGADAMGGSSDPDGDRGFGRVRLESAMPFDGEDVWALYVEDYDGTTTGTGTVRDFFFFVILYNCLFLIVVFFFCVLCCGAWQSLAGWSEGVFQYFSPGVVVEVDSRARRRRGNAEGVPE